MTDAPKGQRQALAIELAIVTAAVLVVAHALFLMRGVAVIGQAISTVVAVLLIYAPVLTLWRKRRPIDFLDRGVPATVRSTLVFLVAALVIFPPFLLAAHGWQVLVAGAGPFHPAVMPQFWHAFAAQLVLIALPEEFFFRGYFQSTMNRMFSRPWRVLGVQLGWGWIITALVFAFAHSVIFYRWWHFAIFFPALVFGYLRERTGSITAPILFHAASNILMQWFVSCYLPA